MSTQTPRCRILKHVVVKQQTISAICLRADVLHAAEGARLAFSDAKAAIAFQIHINEQIGTAEALAQIAGLRAAIGVIADLEPLVSEIALETIGGQNVNRN